MVKTKQPAAAGPAAPAPDLTADQYEYLWAIDAAAARAAVRAMGDRALGLAVQLAARRAPGAIGSTYEYWLRIWQKIELPAPLVQAGWAWNMEGTRLINDRLHLELKQSGQKAIDAALKLIGHLPAAPEAVPAALLAPTAAPAAPKARRIARAPLVQADDMQQQVLL